MTLSPASTSQRRWDFTRMPGRRAQHGGVLGADGMVIDVSGIHYVRVDAAGATAAVGAGANFAQLYAELSLFGLHVPGGGCETVCVGGYMQGGGYSFTSLLFGMNCDNVTGVQIALADGRIVTANADEHRDLFWRCPRRWYGQQLRSATRNTVPFAQTRAVVGIRVQMARRHRRRGRCSQQCCSRLARALRRGSRAEGSRQSIVTRVYAGSWRRESRALLRDPGNVQRFGDGMPQGSNRCSSWRRMPSAVATSGARVPMRS